MNKHSQLFTITIVLFLFSLVVLACKISVPVKFGNTAPDRSATSIPEKIPPSPVSAESISLTDVSTGLAGLKSYHASLVQSVAGSLDGKPYDRETRYDLTRLSGQIDFIREIDGKDEPQPYFRIMTDGKAVSRWVSADESCRGTGGDAVKGEILEPASLLLPITSGVRVGSETVNKIPAIHYTFDEGGLQLSDPKPSVQGEVWIAEQGGYVVKYSMKAAAPSKLTGKGYEVERGFEYELSEVDSIESIDLPEVCRRVPVDIPAMPDAVDVSLGNGSLSFTTPSSGSDVIDFYLEELKTLGWTTNQKIPSALKFPYAVTFVKENQELTLNLDAATVSTMEVLILINPKSPQPERVSVMTSEPEPTVQPSPESTLSPGESGLPDDIPDYPGATGLFNTGGLVSFETTDPVTTVADFYKKELTDLNWEKVIENTSGDTTVLLWQKSGRMITISFTGIDGKTQIIIVQTEQ